MRKKEMLKRTNIVAVVYTTTIFPGNINVNRGSLYPKLKLKT